MKRKITFLALVGSLAVSLVACNNAEPSVSEPILQQENIVTIVEQKKSNSPLEKTTEIEIKKEIVETTEITEKPQQVESPVEEKPIIIPTEKPVASLEPVTPSTPIETPKATPEPTPTPQPRVTPEAPVTAPTPEPIFDVNYWVEFGKNYGQSIGLQLDSSVTGSWDTPIGANSKCIYLERDIKDALNWYRNDYGFEFFWIWSEEIGENRYNIYIGYA